MHVISDFMCLRRLMWKVFGILLVGRPHADRNLSTAVIAEMYFFAAVAFGLESKYGSLIIDTRKSDRTVS